VQEEKRSAEVSGQGNGREIMREPYLPIPAQVIPRISFSGIDAGITICKGCKRARCLQGSKERFEWESILHTQTLEDRSQNLEYCIQSS